MAPGTQYATFDVDDSAILEWHFHTYFFHKNKDSVEFAKAMHANISEQMKKGYFPPKGLEPIFFDPIGPHPLGMFQLWVPEEYFANVFQWYVQNRGDLAVLIHPLTRKELMDHTVRGTWMGFKVPLDVQDAYITDTLPNVAIQHPELCLGYSKQEARCKSSKHEHSEI